MTFDELRIKLGGGPIDARHGWLACEIPVLPLHLLESLPGLTLLDTGFPGCFAFLVPVAEGGARYTGVCEIGRNPRKHGKGRLELLPYLVGG